MIPRSSSTTSPSPWRRTVIDTDTGRLQPEDGQARPARRSDPTMLVPPCVVFIDEVHGLPRNLRDELLKAIESKDRMLNIEGGWYADCRNVCWIVATTERGKLFGPFDTRFTKVELEMYGAEEIAAHRPARQPRLEHAALPPRRQVLPAASPGRRWTSPRRWSRSADLNGGGDWEAVAARVARSLKIDRYGLTRQRLNVLVALGQVGAVSKGRMADYAGCGMEELEKFVMPALLVATTDDPAMVAVTNKGYAITMARAGGTGQAGHPAPWARRSWRKADSGSTSAPGTLTTSAMRPRGARKRWNVLPVAEPEPAFHAGRKGLAYYLAEAHPSRCRAQGARLLSRGNGKKEETMRILLKIVVFCVAFVLLCVLPPAGAAALFFLGVTNYYIQKGRRR